MRVHQQKMKEAEVVRYNYIASYSLFQIIMCLFIRDFPDESDYTISGSAQTYHSEEGEESGGRVLRSPSPDSPTQILLQGLGKTSQDENGRQV